MPSDYTSHYPVILIKKKKKKKKKLQECIGIVSGTLRWCPPLQLHRFSSIRRKLTSQNMPTRTPKAVSKTVLPSAANVR
ncbi:BAK_1a_G0027140.mRNA.1.CDS.1 [Saccharomyces cerevisiae]|nr:BAK_1a_G0027140.mRNA.1.CDS.1 [Saccharomyces cerevisiae]CAI7093944.1 BAK_1a_G0027140.mRNA.1.CDS.1 [Saccharomyces cerevisiae]